MSVLTQVADRVSGGRLTRKDFEQRFERYLRDGSPKTGDGEALNEAFLKSAGRWLTEASRKMQTTAPTYDFSNAKDVLGLWKQPGSMDKALADLNQQGFALLDTSLSPDVVRQLSDFCAAAPCTLTSDRGTTLAADETVTVDFDAPLAEKYAVTTGALVGDDLVRRMMLDRGLLEVAQRYIGTAPIIDIVTAWYSFPSASPSHEAAQLFHFDLDRVRWLKAFFLLTDQTVETGAHVYIPGTHRDGGIDDQLLAKGYVRLEDDDVERFYPRQTWKSMEAPAGSILLEDTRGLHKGTSLRKDYRLMLQFEYAQSLFGHVPHLATAELPLVEDAYWQQMQATYPAVFGALAR